MSEEEDLATSWQALGQALTDQTMGVLAPQPRLNANAAFAKRMRQEFQCVALAWRVLGRDAPHEEIVAQANDFMKMSDDALNRTILRIGVPGCSHPEFLRYARDGILHCGVCHMGHADLGRGSV